MCMKKKEEVAPMTVDAIVAKLKEVGDVFADKLVATVGEGIKKNAEVVRKSFYEFADQIEKSFATSVKDAVVDRLKKLEDLNVASRTMILDQQIRILNQQAILRAAYAERDELKCQLDALKGAAE